MSRENNARNLETYYVVLLSTKEGQSVFLLALTGISTRNFHQALLGIDAGGGKGLHLKGGVLMRRD